MDKPKTPRTVIGLDIGASAIKLVELSDHGRRQEVTAYADLVFPSQLKPASPPVKIASDQTISLVAKLIKAANASAQDVVASLPASAVFSALVTLPGLPREELSAAVQRKAREVVPTDLSEMTLTWSRAGQDEHNILLTPAAASKTRPSDYVNHEPDQKQTISAKSKQPQLVTATIAPDIAAKLEGSSSFYLTAVPHKLIAWYTQLAAALKLNLAALEVEIFPLLQVHRDAAKNTVMFCNIGGQQTSYYIVSDGVVKLQRILSYGIRHISQAVAATLQIQAAPAIQSIRDFGFTASGPPTSLLAIEDAFRPLLREAEQLLSQYENLHQHTPDQIILVGGGARVPALRDYWGTVLQRDTIISNPWQGLSYPHLLSNRLRRVGPEYTVAVGLAQHQLRRKL